MTPDEWNAALAPGQPWQAAYGTVERVTKALIDTWPLGEFSSTADLVEELYPAGLVRGDAGQHARTRIFKALMALAPRGLAPYARQGAPRPPKNWRLKKTVKEIRPWEWSRPEAPSIPEPIATPHVAVEAHTCPHCGEELF